MISDKLIILGNRTKKAKVPLQEARIVVYYKQASGKTFEFLTNNQELSALTIAGIYKRRWQIESLFKRIKQNFQLHNFLGDNQNAIEIQIWCTLIADLLTKVVKDRQTGLEKPTGRFQCRRPDQAAPGNLYRPDQIPYKSRKSVDRLPGKNPGISMNSL